MNAKTKLILAGVLASVAVVGLWYVLLWSPTKGNLGKANSRKAAAESQTQTLLTHLATLKQLEARKPQLDADRNLLATAIPDRDQLDAFILGIDRTAADARVSFVSIAPTPPAAAPPQPGTPPGPPTVNLSIQVSGDYFSILRFLDLVRDGDRLVTVQNVSLAKGGTNGEMTASITGRMFLAQLATPAAGAPAPAPATTPAAPPVTG